MVGWGTFLGFGAAMTAAFVLAPADGVLQESLFLATNTAAVGALLVGVRRQRLAPAGAWRVLVAAAVVYWVATIAWLFYPVVWGRPLPFPSIVDPMYWAAYLGWFAFLVVVVRIRGRGIGAVTDALVVAGGAAVVGWETLIKPMLDADLPSVVTAASLTYWVLLTALAAAAVRAGMERVEARAVHALLVAWIGLELVADVWYSLASANGTFHLGSPWSATWLLSYTALGALSLHPRLPTLAAPSTSERQLTPRGRLVLLTVAGMLPMATMLLRDLRHHGPDDHTVINAISIAVFVAIMARLARSTAHLRTERQLRRELEHAAVHDPLTGLANRVGFHEGLRRALALRHTGDRAPIVMLADLDGFKAVNDTYGHQAGDELLQEVARRLTDTVRPGDTVARLGGDEFAVVIDDIGLLEGMVLADRIVAAITVPIPLGPATPVMGMSLGVYHAAPGDDPDEALRHADAAMYAAKNAGGGVELFEPERHRAYLDRYRLDVQLRAAPAAGELVLHYQPIYRLADRAVVGAEALVRWQHPDRGWLLPGAFIDVAETSGAIIDIDRWVLDEACRAAAAWQGLAAGTSVTVNLSRRHLRDSDIVAHVADALAESGLTPHLLTLEVTETAVTSDIDGMLRVLEQLAGLGVGLALDDFGTGYSSLTDLRRMPIDLLKLDRGFVTGIAHSEQEWALAAAIFRLATSLDKHTLAEGIEDAGQLAHLRSLGCELGQGYLFAGPMPIDDLREELLRASIAHNGGLTGTLTDGN